MDADGGSGRDGYFAVVWSVDLGVVACGFCVVGVGKAEAEPVGGLLFVWDFDCQ